MRGCGKCGADVFLRPNEQPVVFLEQAELSEKVIIYAVFNRRDEVGFCYSLSRMPRCHAKSHVETRSATFRSRDLGRDRESGANAVNVLNAVVNPYIYGG